MKVKIQNIPIAIFYFVLGIVVNYVLFKLFSPDEADMIGILSNVLGTDTVISSTVYIGIMAIGILLNILYPLWTLFSDGD